MHQSANNHWFLPDLGSIKQHFEVKPESRPINDSPSYIIETQGLSRPVEVCLDFGHYSPRFWPLVSSQDYHPWRNTPVKQQQVRGRNQLIFQWPANKTTSMISSHYLWSHHDQATWIERMQQMYHLESIIIGQTPNHLPLVSLGRSNPGKPLVICLARQHPVETNGQQACLSFVEALWKRTDWSVWVIGHANPDGVLLNHWRHNSQNLDMNRDWGVFKAKETKLIMSFLNRMQWLDQASWCLDFHSTSKSCMFVPSEHLLMDPIVKAWSRLSQYPLVLNAQSQSWASFTHHAWGKTSVTLELSESLHYRQARLAGEVLAKNLMKVYV